MISNEPLSEQFRLAAKAWVDADGAARMLEELKTTVLAQWVKQQGDMPVAHAEREVKSSPQWEEYIDKMVRAKTAANHLKIDVEYIRMKASEHQSFEANQRAERRI